MLKFLDLLTDERLPWFLPLWLYRRGSFFKPPVDQIQVAITFDVEENYPEKSLKKVGAILSKFQAILKKHDVLATFFVQGSIVPELSPTLKKLARAGHEIGLHGYEHNNWGKSVWYLSQKPLSSEQKLAGLTKSLEIFRKYQLPRPRVFRAPYMNYSQQTLKLLEDSQFRIDSSWDSHRRPGNRQFPVGQIREIPVSSLPFPQLVFRFGIPFTMFKPFNLANYLATKENELDQYLKKLGPRLVFLSHPWEYQKNTVFPYCRKENYLKLEKLITHLNRQYHAQFVTISNLTSHGQS